MYTYKYCMFGWKLLLDKGEICFCDVHPLGGGGGGDFTNVCHELF